MNLVDNWKSILKSAWSVRLNWIAMLCALLEVALPFFTGVIPPRTMAILALVATSGAQVARILAQPELHK